MRLLQVFAIINCFLMSGCQFSNEKPSSHHNSHTVRLSIPDDPQSFDPRFVRDLVSVSSIHMLYEGLMRYNAHGKATFALAESVDISPDYKTYTFHLRPSIWSDGEPVSAYDFEFAWKSTLDPKIVAPNANQLYVIKGAKAAKEGKISLDGIGIHALSPKDLTVELESPVPYFLDLAASHFYLPVNKKWVEAGSQTKDLVSNGPFKMQSFKHHNEFVAIKNPLYWNAHAVKLDKIMMQVVDETTGLQLFQTGQLDWHGSPTSTLPADALQTLKAQGQLEILPGAGTHWIRFNTALSPLQNVKLRRALTFAIDRKSLVGHVLQGNQVPALAIVPPSLRLQDKPYFEDHDIPKAWALFQDALEELKISKDEFPTIALCYSQNERNSRIAQTLQQQWKKAFGIEVKLENCEVKVFYDKLARQDYQMSLGSWFADIEDPMNFLQLFQYRSNSTNNTQWENAKYVELLNKSTQEIQRDKRFSTLRQAEQLLIVEMPVAPLFYASFNYVKKHQLKGVYFSPLGFLDFKEAYFDMENEL